MLEALAGLEAVLVRMPDEAGMAVPGEEAWRQRPIHVGDHAFSVLYSFDDDEVLLLSLRQVAAGLFE